MQQSSPSPSGANATCNDDNSHAREIARLKTQLESLDNALDIAKSADDWHKLSTARQRLFDQWRILSGIPLPGSRRPAKEKTKPAPQSYEPVD